jgi:UDP-glucose 4-epimerase
MYFRTLMPKDSVILRFGNVYGPRQVPLGENQVIPKMIRHFEKGDPFFIHGNGQQKRDMVYVEDVARACVNAIEGLPDVYNISSGHAVSVNELALLVAKLYDVPEYPWDHDDKEDMRQKVELDNFAAMEGLNWRPETNLEEGLRKTIEWWKKQ